MPLHRVRHHILFLVLLQEAEKKNTNVSAFWADCTPCSTRYRDIVITVAASNLIYSNNACDHQLSLNCMHRLHFRGIVRTTIGTTVLKFGDRPPPSV